MKYLTDKEIHVMGIQRTGQHAIISWLIGHFENVCFKNNMPQDGENAKLGLLTPPWWKFSPSLKDEWDICNEPEIAPGHDAVILGTEITLPTIGIHKDFSNERIKMAGDRAEFFSKSQRYVLVIRNPYNHYASVLKWKRNKRLRSPDAFAKVWINMAKEVLSETQNIPLMNKDIVIYDEWFSNKNYREIVALNMGLDFTDRRLNTMMKVGINRQWGSSFDGMKSNCQDMDVLNRWKAVKDVPEFKELLKNDELNRYSHKLGFKL